MNSSPPGHRSRRPAPPLYLAAGEISSHCRSCNSLAILSLSLQIVAAAADTTPAPLPVTSEAAYTSIYSAPTSIYSAKRDALSFPRVLSVVPRVWKRLAFTFLSAFALRLVMLFIALLIVADNGSGFAAFLSLPLAVAYLVGLIYVSVVWHLASVVSVLEDYKGLAAMRKSKALIQGNLRTACAIFFTPNFVFVVVKVTFRAWVVQGVRHGLGGGGRFLLGLAMLTALCAVVMVALVVQTVVYLVCKSYHHESIDKSNISDHLEVYLDNYVPLNASDVQMEHFRDDV